jgi:arginase family enzyme
MSAGFRLLEHSNGCPGASETQEPARPVWKHAAHVNRTIAKIGSGAGASAGRRALAPRGSLAGRRPGAASHRPGRARGADLRFVPGGERHPCALHHYTTWCESRRVDVGELWPWDVGDVADPDLEDGDWRVRASVQTALAKSRLLVVLGGDGAVTAPVVAGGYDLAGVGVVAVDAQHDVRDGRASVSSLKKLLDAGLPPAQVAHIGAADWATSRSYSAELRARGVHVTGREAVETEGAADSLRAGIDAAASAADVRAVHVSFDLSVCDRAVAPACRDSIPGGISARQLLAMAFAAGLDKRVSSIDIVEVDANEDAADQRTVRLAALVVLEVAAGLALRVS